MKQILLSVLVVGLVWGFISVGYAVESGVLQKQGNIYVVKSGGTSAAVYYADDLKQWVANSDVWSSDILGQTKLQILHKSSHAITVKLNGVSKQMYIIPGSEDWSSNSSYVQSKSLDELIKSTMSTLGGAMEMD